MNEVDELNNPVKLIYEKPNERWEIAVTVSEMGFQQVSFVNSIATTKGGRHVDYIVDQIVKHLLEIVNKKKNGSQAKPFQVKQHMWVFINCLIENPTFDSQTKENMTLQAKNFGSTCKLSDEFFKKGQFISKYLYLRNNSLFQRDSYIFLTFFFKTLTLKKRQNRVYWTKSKHGWHSRSVRI
jgi:DNA gyrase/topoisomerase IV subunit B